MSASARRNGYADATRTTGTPRAVEYQLLARITGKLNRASAPGAEFPALAEALHLNLELWTAIGIDVMGDGNGLPPDLRARLFYLFEFTRAHTPKVLRREADARPLIDINTAIMRGLRTTNAKDLEPCPASS